MKWWRLIAALLLTALIFVSLSLPTLSPAAVESMAEALTGTAIDPLRSWYEKADAAYEMADGSFRPTETDRHPHPTAEAIRWHIAEGELIQIIGRARGVNRTAANPVDVLVLTSTPLPIPVERLITASDIDPSPADVMMAAGGVSFENPADASTSYQQIWATRNAAKKAMEKHREGILGSNRNKEYLITVRPQDRREGPSHVRVDYQLPGHGKRPSTAWVDLNIVSDPEAWLTERLGPLANFALGPAKQEAVVVLSLPEIPGGYGENFDPGSLFPHLVRPAGPLEGFRVRRPEV
jgi:putative DNA primase/helicase